MPHMPDSIIMSEPLIYGIIYNLKGHDGVRCDMKDRVL